MNRRHAAWTLIAAAGFVVFAAAQSPALVLAAGITALIGVCGFAWEIER